jgi:REP element-mobilizing transposase RayT
MMKIDPQEHRRRSIRLQEYDYGTPGAYFVTICTQERECILDDPVVSGIIRDVWNALPRWFPTIALDEFVIMPNHLHFILWIHPADMGASGAGAVGAALAAAPGTGTTGAGANRAGASPAPTGRPPRGRPTEAGAVGAALAAAPGTGATGAGANRAGASPAPTGRPHAVAPTGAGAVGAALAAAPLAAAPLAAAPLAATPHPAAPGAAAPAEWVIPDPQSMNLHPKLSDVVGAFKSLVFKVYLDWTRSHDPERQARFWQRNYYEHVIRNERELAAIRDYIRQNPDNWNADRDNLDNIRHLAPPKETNEYVLEATEGYKSELWQNREQQAGMET